MNIYKVSADGSRLSLKPEMSKAAAGDTVDFEVLLKASVFIGVEEDGTPHIRVEMPPGFHNMGLRDEKGRNDWEALAEVINEMIKPYLPDAALGTATVSVPGAPELSAALQQLVDEADAALLAEEPAVTQEAPPSDLFTAPKAPAKEAPQKAPEKKITAPKPTVPVAAPRPQTRAV